MQAISQVATLMDQTQTSNLDQHYTAIVNEHLDEIYNFARYMVLDYDEAEDIVQKTFLSFYHNFKKLDLSLNIRPWLFKVARNHCLDYLKKKKNLQFSEVEEQIAEISLEDPSLEERLDSLIFLEKFKQLVENLPVNIKEILLLKYFQDMTFEQIAETVSLPVNTVKSHFYRGKIKLCQLFKDETGLA
jgi:RNA polymerase sigma-70 factor (ECF subfamily)